MARSAFILLLALLTGAAIPALAILIRRFVEYVPDDWD